MARIRTIKPEFWSSEQVMECSPNARLLFIGLWNFADDSGRMTSSTKRIKAQVFPSDDFSSDTVRGMIDELHSNGLILLYVIDGIEYLQVTGWRHQKIDKPQASKIPPPPPNPFPTPEKHSPNGSRTVAVGREGILGERKGEEPNPDRQQPTQPASPAVRLDEIERLCREAAGLETDPSPGLLVIGPIADLIDAGWSLERHILPALRSAKAAGRRGRKWGYYVPAITDGAKTPPQALPPPEPAPVVLPTPQQMAELFINANRWLWPTVPEFGQPGCPVTSQMINDAKWRHAERARQMIEHQESEDAA